ncbi:hypothetical protein [Streptomyces paludis]|uniref:hypothetical protein n=1 Tax=Streptomyces paludis TaxID=2282738 RepID=UPI001E2B381A|nr:hypothetical protein [Streptomyces paludis]
MDQEQTEEKKRKIELSVPQVAGSALAAVAAAVLASRLGVYGTIIGAGVVSVVATCGGSVFSHLFRRTGEQLKVVTEQAVRTGGRQVPVEPEPERADGFGPATTHRTRARGRRRPVIAAGVVFLVAMLGITGFELISGQNLDGGTGTTVGYAVSGGHGRATPATTPATSTVPTSPQSPSAPASTDTGTAGTGDTSASPSTSPSPSATASDSAGSSDGSGSSGTTPTPAPSGSADPTGTAGSGAGDTGGASDATGASGTTGTTGG